MKRSNHAALALGLALATLHCGGRPRRTPVPGAIILDCTPEMFLDVRATGERVDITFGGSPADFRPACVLLAPGQQVRFVGSFAPHPLAPGIPPDRDEPAPPGNNPIAFRNEGTVMVTTFPDVGVFPYYCATHYATAGMVGAVIVRPASAPWPDPVPDPESDAGSADAAAQ